VNKRRLDFEHNGQTYSARLVSRPFREGQEAILVVGEQTITIAELGFGDLALIERFKAELDKLVPSQ